MQPSTMMTIAMVKITPFINRLVSRKVLAVSVLFSIHSLPNLCILQPFPMASIQETEMAFFGTTPQLLEVDLVQH